MQIFFGPDGLQVYQIFKKTIKNAIPVKIKIHWNFDAKSLIEDNDSRKLQWVML